MPIATRRTPARAKRGCGQDGVEHAPAEVGGRGQRSLHHQHRDRAEQDAGAEACAESKSRDAVEGGLDAEQEDVATGPVFEGTEDGQWSDAEEQAGGDQGVRHAAVAVSAADARLDGVAETVEQAVEVESTADRRSHQQRQEHHSEVRGHCSAERGAEGGAQSVDDREETEDDHQPLAHAGRDAVAGADADAAAGEHRRGQGEESRGARGVVQAGRAARAPR